ncbi:hypothetical protein RND81_06G089800 [Saponaria officinalis]|uniref:Uncharacterized protein n=1 Tax=Saponaria officinalis TaxID=3572 RepID=A0AAW1K920_SAPOF
MKMYTKTITSQELKGIKQEAEETPKTPTSDENKIPAPRSPPPAPRKRRRVAMQCVRKLEFFEHRSTIPTEQAVQEFLTSSFDHINSRKLLKRSSSLAFDRLTSNSVSIATQII